MTDKLKSSNWGGKRKGAGRKLKSTSDTDELFRHYMKKYKLDPLETQFKILEDLDEDKTLHATKLKAAISKDLMQHCMPKVQEVFTDEDGNEFLPSTQSELDAELARLTAKLSENGGE